MARNERKTMKWGEVAVNSNDKQRETLSALFVCKENELHEQSLTSGLPRANVEMSLFERIREDNRQFVHRRQRLCVA